MQTGDEGHADHATRAVTIGRERGHGLTLAEVARVARNGAPVRLAPSAAERVQTARAFIEHISAEGATVYGVTTGFGRLSGVKIPGDQLERLQQNLIRSHASGVGE